MYWKVMMNIFFLFFLPDIQAHESQTALGFKVPNALTKHVEKCFLEEHRIFTPGLGGKLGCVSLCLSTPKCLLACLRGQTCRLYKANVSPQWTGTDDIGPELTNSKCYSIWAEHGDLAPYATFHASSLYNNHYSAEAADGFGCEMVHINMFISNSESKPWIEADLGSAKWIDRVVVQARGNVTAPTFFENAYARVGTAAGRGNYGASTLLMYYQGPASFGEVVTFKGDGPILGRYVSIQLSSEYSLIIAEMKIIEA